MLLIVTILFVLAGCSSKTNGNLHNPDKIIVKVEENQKELEKGKDKYSDVIFDRILELIEIRTSSNLDLVTMEIFDDMIKEAKKNCVILIYNKPVSDILENGNKEKIQYTEFIVSTEKEYENVAFVKEVDGQYIPIGLKENLDYLMKSYIKN